MNTKYSRENIFGGPVKLGYIDNETGLWTPKVIAPKNLIMYGADDILGKLIAGDTNYLINTVYFEFSNNDEGSLPTPTATKDNGQSYYNALTGVQLDFIRTTISTTGTTTATDADHESNKSTLLAVASGSAGVKGLSFSTDSFVLGAALVASPTGSFSGDVVFSRIYFDTPLPKLNNSQIGIEWSITFSDS